MPHSESPVLGFWCHTAQILHFWIAAIFSTAAAVGSLPSGFSRPINPHVLNKHCGFFQGKSLFFVNNTALKGTLPAPLLPTGANTSGASCAPASPLTAPRESLRAETLTSPHLITLTSPSSCCHVCRMIWRRCLSTPS